MNIYTRSERKNQNMTKVTFSAVTVFLKGKSEAIPVQVLEALRVARG
jgi:hypothetical protein